MSVGVTVAQYGSWKSPISSLLATESSVAFQELHVDKGTRDNGTVYWSEMRFTEGGRYVICSCQPNDTSYTSWTPTGFNARTKVHEYGGGAFFVHNGVVYFSNFDDQRMYVQSGASESPVAITPENCGWRYADGHFNEQHKSIYCIREDHSLVEKGEAKQPENTVVLINPNTQEQKVLVSGATFYSSSRVSPDGKQLCWIQWFHPNMPWDDTELWVVQLDPDQHTLIPGTAKKVVGEKGVCVMAPEWTNENELTYICDKSDWWNLYHMTSSGEHVCVEARSEEIGEPHWIFADYAYDFERKNNGRIVTAYGKVLELLDLPTKTMKPIDTGFASHNFLQFSTDGNIYCVGGSTTQFPCVLRVSPTTNKIDIIRESRSVPCDAGYFSVPKKISWPTSDNQVSYGFYYPPQNKDYAPLEGSYPPLLVRAHGGPTGAACNSLNLQTQYFTSRGFAVLDVDYRGSTGYGKKYRNTLKGRWGLCDVEDCCNGALYLADNKMADPKRLCIDGGSAGGYTTLACLVFKNVFGAGASHYGIGDLETLAAETHKFESRYCDTLVGPYIPENYQMYKDRSPINHLDQLDCPIALFQGDEDEIVPPNQAKMMYEAVKSKGLPTTFVLFEGEQHGFRKAENLQMALDGEFYFFSRVFGFDPADKHCKLPIDNL